MCHLGIFGPLVGGQDGHLYGGQYFVFGQFGLEGVAEEVPGGDAAIGPTRPLNIEFGIQCGQRGCWGRP